MMKTSKKFIVLFLTFIFIITGTQVLAIWDIDGEEGLIGYWNFNHLEGGEVLTYSDLEDYEEGTIPEGWTIFSGDPVISSEKAFSGKHSIKLVDPSTTASVGLRTSKVKVEEGLLYAAYSRYFNESGNASIYFEFWDDGNNRIKFTSVKCDKVGEWNMVSARDIAPEGAKYATLLVYSDTVNVGTSYYDDLRIERPSSVRDISGNERHGLVYGNTHLADGRFGQALKFDGKIDYVEIPYDPGLRSSEAISFEAWIYPTPPHQANSNGGIINNLNGLANSRILVASNGRMNVQLHGYQEAVLSVSLIPKEAWTHIVYVYDGKEEKIYIDGKEDLSSPYSKKLGVGSNPLTIGWGHTGDNYHYNGLIDEVKLYNRALSPEEVAFKASNPPKWNEMVSYPNPAPMDAVVKMACFVDKACDVELIIYDESGKQIAKFDGLADKGGYYQLEWNGKDKNGNSVPPGVYLVQASTIEDGKRDPLARGLIVKVP
jgi:hypothetical protein